jgi:hypothetical protein
MGIRDTDHLTFVLKTEHMIDLRALAKVECLLLPDTNNIRDMWQTHLG